MPAEEDRTANLLAGIRTYELRGWKATRRKELRDQRGACNECGALRFVRVEMNTKNIWLT